MSGSPFYYFGVVALFVALQKRSFFKWSKAHETSIQTELLGLDFINQL
jgi:hypothetical protein